MVSSKVRLNRATEQSLPIISAKPTEGASQFPKLRKPTRNRKQIFGGTYDETIFNRCCDDSARNEWTTSFCAKWWRRLDCRHCYRSHNSCCFWCDGDCE